MRQIALDTETTGLSVSSGHRVIEVGAVEIQDRKITGKRFHHYLNPDRDVDDGAFEVHGISSAFLADKPLFADIQDAFLEFIEGAELIAHNASFDLGFLDNELDGTTIVEHSATVIDSLALARKKHFGRRNTLNALCSRYGIDISERNLHGALLDADLLADVYLEMTGGQSELVLEDDAKKNNRNVFFLPENRPRLKVVQASAEERAAHEAYMKSLKEDE